jgi:hypothetical protein
MTVVGQFHWQIQTDALPAGPGACQPSKFAVR